MESITKNILDKFCGLLFFLKKSKKEFELVADEIGESSLRTALNSLSEESNFYAGEIKQQLKSLGIHAEVPDDYPDHYDESVPENYELAEGPGRELNNICSFNEFSLRKAYNDLITESIPYQSLKEIMIYQLNALTYTFMKIKTLNTARFLSY
jgi:hypothetical protein